MSGKKGLSRVVLAALALGLGACTAPRSGVDTPEGRAAILDRVHRLLSRESCDSTVAVTPGVLAAIGQIEPLFASPFTDNAVRMTRASAHACLGGVNFFRIAQELTTNDLTSSNFWRLTARVFQSTDMTELDRHIVSTQLAMDTLLAVTTPGLVIASQNQVNAGTGNVGSVLVDDRTLDANTYQIWVSMAAFGALQNRYSAPDPGTFNRTEVLGFLPSTPDGWQNAANNTAASQDGSLGGCTAASALLNLFDSIRTVSDQIGGETGSALLPISVQFSNLLGEACDGGCQRLASGVNGIDFTIVGGTCTFAPTQCRGVVDGAPCPLLLRDRANCARTDAVGAQLRCAAAGMMRFLNEDLNGWPP